MDPWAFDDDDECDTGGIAAAAPGKVAPGPRTVAAAPTAKSVLSVEPKDMDLPALRVAELKDLCRARSLPVSGACVLGEYHSLVSPLRLALRARSALH